MDALLELGADDASDVELLVLVESAGVLRRCSELVANGLIFNCESAGQGLCDERGGGGGGSSRHDGHFE